MAKSRFIRPEIWTDEKFVRMTPLARLLFIGMWNHACDNGHLDDSALQLKMRVLPADACDVEPLIDEVVESGMVRRHGGCLKVVNLAAIQPLDLRYLQFCDHCDSDPEAHYAREDKKGGRAQPAKRTRGARVQPASGLGSVGVGVGGDVGVGEEPTSATLRAADDDQPTRPEIDDLCQHLADRIEANGSKRPSITKRWRTSARLLLDVDGRTPDQVRAAIDWCQQDEFWRSNVMSMPKLREKYDQLRLAATRNRPGRDRVSDILRGEYAWAEQAEREHAASRPAIGGAS